MRQVSIVFFTLFSLTLRAEQAPVEQILSNLMGCFKVQYQFVEDGVHDKLYSPIYEWIRPKQAEGEIVLEHIGQYPLYNDDGSIQTDDRGNQIFFSQYHWREHWSVVDKAARLWHQKVYGPFDRDSFRYECDGKWVMNQFHCHTDRAAVPRRDRKRGYDHMKRINNLQVNHKRWVHGQRNLKKMENGETVGVELGWNTYVKVEDGLCQAAIDSNAQPIPRDQ